MNDDISESTGENKLSAGLISQGKIAMRGIASMFRRIPSPNNPANRAGCEVVSPDTAREKRVPPGQVRAKRWPILHVGRTPKVDLASWHISIDGLVTSPKRFTYEEFRALPASRVFADMHCVTRWSLLDNSWEGVLVSEVMKHVELKPEAKFVMVHAEQGYSTNLPIEEFFGDDCLFAWGHNGVPLEPDHGWPLRLVIPRLYAWKSAKWVRRLEFLEHNEPGFWEQNGYHMHGDPWIQERFS